MAIFQYKAVGTDGRMVHGRIDAVNVADLEMRLKRMELDLVTGEPVGHGGFLRGNKVPRRELITFCFHMEQLTRAGVPIIEGLADLRDSLEHPRFREVIAGVIEDIEGGLTLSDAMAQHPTVFDNVFVNLIRAGETTGRLPEVLHSIIEGLKWEDELAAHTQKALMYPSFVAAIVLTATAFLMVYMVPQLKQFVKNMGQELPLQTKVLFFISDVLVAYWYLFLAFPILAVVIGALVVRNNPAARLRFDSLKLRLPAVGGILRKIILSRFAATFALLYSSGIPVLEGVRTTQSVVGNRVIEDGLIRVEQLIVEGQNITTAFHTVGLFPPLVIRMLRVGENTGALDEALTNVSYFYNRDVKESVERLQAMVEPALTMILGCMLGWIMLSVLGPVYDVISKIKI